MSPQTFRIPVYSFRTIPTPYQETGKKNSLAIVRVSDLPDLENWRRVNVRGVSKRAHIFQDIKRSLAGSLADEPNDDFVFMNRGLVISAARCEFDNKIGVLMIDLEDNSIHGLLDGGHTYEAIREALADLRQEQYVKVEFLEGFSKDDIDDVVEARNTSTQVEEKSLLNLQGKFEPLKKEIAGTIYADKIAYRENEDRELKPIDIRQLISFLYLFDVTAHRKSEEQPKLAYVSKERCLDYFAANENWTRFKGIYTLADDIFKLWDYIHLYLPDLYNAATKGRFHQLSFMKPDDHRKVELHFIGKLAKYPVPDALKYPILAAFRAFVEVDQEGFHYWGNKVDPLQLLQGELGRELARDIGDSIKRTRNPNMTGKDDNLWRSCHRAAENVYLRMRLGLS